MAKHRMGHEPRHGTSLDLSADEIALKRLLSESSTRIGLGVAAIRVQLQIAPADTWRVTRALENLIALGEVSRRKKGGSSWLYYVDGADRLPPGEGFTLGDHRVELSETPEMSEKLFALFSICPHRYSDGNVIQLERGKVAMRPETLTAGRVAGAW